MTHPEPLEVTNRHCTWSPTTSFRDFRVADHLGVIASPSE